jgi:hypothetical protein
MHLICVVSILYSNKNVYNQILPNLFDGDRIISNENMLSTCPHKQTPCIQKIEVKKNCYHF